MNAKLVEIDGKMEELRREIVVLEAQKSAFETVIRVYDPGFELAAPPSTAGRASSRETASGRVTELLKGKNNRHIGGKEQKRGIGSAVRTEAGATVQERLRGSDRGIRTGDFKASRVAGASRHGGPWLRYV
ncbi:hypothetical protein ELH80_14105 [Rhizobium ruizarguesonis]|uniref:hypothetical protein n=1 Tax=Rhizobium ruizarguesonis TaxID=2081791 RepID=UPI0010307707|nr:hypothetical protein [Rhizobium ruizarguesonis]TAZ35418.1 hypothetical protein ELH80_14105 [Rhizobium ruizarguesonis]